MGISPSHTHTLPIKSALTVQIIAHIMFKRHEWTLGLDVSLGEFIREFIGLGVRFLLFACLLYTSPSPRDATLSRMPSSA